MKKKTGNKKVTRKSPHPVARNPPGRPSPITPELTKELAGVLQTGSFIETAVTFVGISRDTFYEWMKRGVKERARILSGEEPDPAEEKYLQFSDTIKKALASAEVRLVGILAKGAEKNPFLACWLLERKFTNRWGRHRLEITGKDGEPLSQLPPGALVVNLVKRNGTGEVEMTEIKSAKKIREIKQMDDGMDLES